MRGRLYDARLGRFASADPYSSGSLTQGLNRYSYVLNSPLARVDPSGFQSLCIASDLEGNKSDCETPPGLRNLADPRLISPPQTAGSPARAVPVATEASPATAASSDEVSALDAATLNRNTGLPPGWPEQRPPTLRPQMCVGDFCNNNGPPEKRLPAFLGYWERVEAARVQEFETDVWQAKASINVGMTLPTLGIGAIRNQATGILPNVVAGEWRLVRANRAILDPRKLTEFALNPGHPVGRNKARVFEKLGFNRGNADELMQQLRIGVMENTPIVGKADQFGARFTVDIPVVGPAGSGVVRTGWIFKTGSDIPELTTLFVR